MSLLEGGVFKVDVVLRLGRNLGALLCPAYLDLRAGHTATIVPVAHDLNLVNVLLMA
jgi:hypothetical protein